MLSSKIRRNRPVIKEKNPEDIVVRLKPLLGFQPRTYVPAAWIIILSTVVFFLLILPGIRKNGTWMTIYSDPPDVSILVNGVRLGATGRPVFVEKGPQTISLRRPGFRDETLTRTVRGRVFASRLFPRRETLTLSLEAENGYPLWSEAARNFASWVATGAEQNRYALPPVLTTASRDSAASGTDSISLEEYFTAVLPMARDSRHLADVLRGGWNIDNPDTALSPWSLLLFLDGIAETEDSRPDLIAGVVKAIDGTGDLAGERFSPGQESFGGIRDSSYFQPEIIGGMSFVRIPALRAPVGDMEVLVAGDYKTRFGAHPVMVRTGSYRIGIREVSNDEFARFVEDNPQWSPSSRDALVRSGLVDPDFLRSWSAAGPAEKTGDLPVTHVSWYAADAYARWFGETFLPAGEIARLPREDEWEIAARLNSVVADTSELPAGIKTTGAADIGALGILGMAGNVREWCFNPFRYNENLYRYQTGEPSYQHPDDPLASRLRPVRGGAHIDGSLLFPAAVRGALGASRSSPVIGFRIVIVPSSR